jgi:hypothetical protein
MLEETVQTIIAVFHLIKISIETLFDHSSSLLIRIVNVNLEKLATAPNFLVAD